MSEGSAPRVSVLVPSHNRADSLPGVLESIFAQSLPPAEVLLVDDGSTDDTARVVAELLERHPSWRGRLDFAVQENKGKSVALNHALSRTTGEWISFDDSDDTWHPEKLELQMRALAANPDCRACFADARFVNNPAMATTAFARAGRSYSLESGRIEDPVRLIVTPPHGVFMQTVVVRADAMREVGEFDPRFRVSQDTDFLFRLALRTKLCYVNRPLVEIDRTVCRAEGLTTHSGRESLARLETFRAIYQKWGDLAAGCDPEVRGAIRRLGRAILSEQATWHLVRDEPSRACARLAELLRSGFAPRPALKWLLISIAPGLAKRLWVRRSALRTPP